MSEKQPFKWVLLNAAYSFVALAVSLLVSLLVRIACNIVIPIEEVARQGGDYSHNYLFVFPIHGVVSAVVFLLTVYLISKKFGFSTGFRYRSKLSMPEFLIQSVLAVLAYLFLFIYMFEWWEFLPTWYLSGFLAALFGVFDPGDVNQYAAMLGGAAEPERLYWMYIWLHLVLEAIFLIGTIFIMRIGRKSGEANAEKEHEAQMAELQEEKERLANKKSL